MALGALFYPKGTDENPIPFQSLFIPWIYNEIYMEGLYGDILNGRKEMTIIDAGANIGIVTQFMRDYAKKIYAVEPSAEHFEALKANKEHNKWDNVELFNVAFADKDGEMTLNYLPGNRTSNSIVNNYKQGTQTCKTVAFDTFFEQNKIEEVDFMKFDVEGAEDMILRSEGFLKVAPKIKAIEIEFHYPTFPQLVEHLMSLGYKARRFDSSAVVILFTR